MTDEPDRPIAPLERRGRVDPEAVAQLLRAEQVRMVYDHLPVSQLVMVLNALVFAAVQSLVIDEHVLIGWFSAVCVVALARIVNWVAFLRVELVPAQVARWRAYIVAGAAVSGLVWGAAAFLLFPPMNAAHQVFVAFMLGGMVAGSVTTLAPLFPAFVLFAVLTLVPAIARFALEHALIQYAMSWMALVFLAAVIVIARGAHRSMSDQIRLRLENSALIGELLSAQDDLRASRDELEKRVAERTSELSKTNAELERFAYVASHDLQEPLRNAANFALLLESRYRDRLDAEGREFLGYIVSGVKQMRELVDDLLFHSRLGAPPRLAPVDCQALLGKVLSHFRTAIAECGATVTHDALPVVRADAGQLEQVVINLLSNAIKFRGANRLHVRIGVEALPAEWRFSFSDNGIGIDPRYHAQIFKMFERLHGNERYPGTGMGLAICHKVLESHHGRIWVESEPGRGSTFVFTLPRTGGREDGGGPAAVDRDPAGGGQPG